MSWDFEGFAIAKLRQWRYNFSRLKEYRRNEYI